MGCTSSWGGPFVTGAARPRGGWTYGTEPAAAGRAPDDRCPLPHTAAREYAERRRALHTTTHGPAKPRRPPAGRAPATAASHPDARSPAVLCSTTCVRRRRPTCSCRECSAWTTPRGGAGGATGRSSSTSSGTGSSTFCPTAARRRSRRNSRATRASRSSAATVAAPTPTARASERQGRFRSPTASTQRGRPRRGLSSRVGGSDRAPASRAARPV